LVEKQGQNCYFFIFTYRYGQPAEFVDSFSALKNICLLRACHATPTPFLQSQGKAVPPSAVRPSANPAMTEQEQLLFHPLQQPMPLLHSSPQQLLHMQQLPVLSPQLLSSHLISPRLLLPSFHQSVSVRPSPDSAQRTSSFSAQRTPVDIRQSSSSAQRTPEVLPSPSSAQRTPVDVRPSPSSAQRTPVDVRPSPSSAQRTPVDVRPSSSSAQRTPVDVRPSSSSTQRAPVDVRPSASSTQRAPVDVRPSSSTQRARVSVPPSSAVRRTLIPGRKRRAGELEDGRYRLFKKVFLKCNSTLHSSTVLKRYVLTAFLNTSPEVDVRFTDQEVTMALEKMEDEHEILLNDDCIYMA